MKRTTAKAILANADLIQAFADGKDIQYRDGVLSAWRDIDTPAFDGDPSQYRIKPDEPKLVSCNPKVWAICRHNDGKVFTRLSQSAAYHVLRKQRSLGFICSMTLLKATVPASIGTAYHLAAR